MMLDEVARQDGFEVKSGTGGRGGFCVCVCVMSHECVCARPLFFFFPSSKTEDEEELATRLLRGSR
jgi:hypothetical protein